MRLATGRLGLAVVAVLSLVPAVARAQDLTHQKTRLAEERLVLRTELGDMVFALYPDVAPATCAHIASLVRLGVYDSARFHRIEPKFVAQLATAEERVFALSGDQLHAVKTRVPPEFQRVVKHLRGTISMAREEGDSNSATTSFSILFSDAPHLDGSYTVFGGIEAGIDVLDALGQVERDEHDVPARKLVVWKASLVAAADLPKVGLRASADHEAATRFAPPPTPMKRVFVAVVAGMSLAGLLVFLLGGRLSPKATGSIGLLIVALGAFYLLLLVVPEIAVAGAGSLAAVGVFAGLVAVLRRMSRRPSPSVEGSAVRAPLYFISAWGDFICVGGLSIVLLGVFKLFHSGARSDDLIALSGWLVWVCNWPHFAATGYRLYASKAVMREHPFSTFGFPIFILAGTAAWIAFPESFAPYYIKFFLIWSGFHYAGQNAVLSHIYARRANLEILPWERAVVFLFSYAAIFSSSALAEVDAQTENYYYGQPYPNLGLPIQWAQLSEYVVWGLALAFVLLAVRWSRRMGRVVPLIVLVPVASHFTWFVLAGTQEGYREFVPFFHCLQYLVLAWGGELQSKLEERSIPPSPGYLAKASLRWYVINVALGAFLFWVLPRGLHYVGVNWNVANGAVVGAIMMMHFYLDAILWRVKDPKVERPLVYANASILSGAEPALVAVGQP